MAINSWDECMLKHPSVCTLTSPWATSIEEIIHVGSMLLMQNVQLVQATTDAIFDILLTPVMLHVILSHVV